MPLRGSRTSRSRPPAARQRGRSNAERLDGASANLRIKFDGRDNGHADRAWNRPRFRTDFESANSEVALTSRKPASHSALTRQRGVSDPSVAAGVTGDPVKNRGRSRHGTAIDCLAGEHATGALGKGRRPSIVQQVPGLVTVHVEEPRVGCDPRTSTPWWSFEERGNTSRRPPVPPGVPPVVPPVDHCVE